MARPSQYDLVAVVGSAHDPGKYWEVKRHRETHALSCNCPAWIFNKSTPKTCKHTAAFAGGIGQPAPMAVASAMLHAVEARRAAKRGTALTATMTHPLNPDRPVRAIILPDDDE